MPEMKEHMTGNPHWEITHFHVETGYGVKYFGTENDAIKWWDENKLDRQMRLVSLCEVKKIRGIGWDNLEKENG